MIPKRTKILVPLALAAGAILAGILFVSRDGQFTLVHLGAILATLAICGIVAAITLRYISRDNPAEQTQRVIRVVALAAIASAVASAIAFLARAFG